MRPNQPQKAQSIIEFTIVIMLVIAGILIAGPYAKRAINAHLKGWEDAVDDSLNDPLQQTQDVSGLPIFCDYDGICDPPAESSDCCDCGSGCGDNICCKDSAGNFIAGDFAGCPDCSTCGINGCEPGEDANNCCQDCGCDPNDGECCTDNEGNPVGCDVDSADCASGYVCGDTTCDRSRGENEMNCCEDCHVCGGTNPICEHLCEHIIDPNSPTFCPGDCCDYFCPNYSTCRSNQDCMNNCPDECCFLVKDDEICDVSCGEGFSNSLCLNGRCDAECGEFQGPGGEPLCYQDCWGCTQDDIDACLGQGGPLIYPPPDPDRCYCHTCTESEYAACSSLSDPSLCFRAGAITGCCKQQWGSDGTYCGGIRRDLSGPYCGASGFCFSPEEGPSGYCVGNCINLTNAYPSCQECFP